MKLNLTARAGIQILAVTEDITAKNFQVLKAGIINLFRKGKNQIVLDVTKAHFKDPLVTRELITLDLAAQELGGEIVLCSADREVKERVEHFSRARNLTVFPQVEQAVRAFDSHRAEETDGKQTPPESPPADPVGEIARLKRALKAKEEGEMGELRKEQEHLRRVNTNLEAKLLRTTETRFTTGDEAYREKTKTFEDRIIRLTEELERVEKKLASQNK